MCVLCPKEHKEEVTLISIKLIYYFFQFYAFLVKRNLMER